MGEGVDSGLGGGEGGAGQTHSRARGVGMAWALGRCLDTHDCQAGGSRPVCPET